MSDDRVIRIEQKLSCLRFKSGPEDSKAQTLKLWNDAKSADPGARLNILLRSISEYRDSGKMLEAEKVELDELEEMIDAALKLEAAGDYKALAGEMIFIGYRWGFFEVADGWHKNLARDFGTKKPRRPEIDKWIAENIRKYPTATRDELWEKTAGKFEDDIGRDRFVKRVSAVRKKIIK